MADVKGIASRFFGCFIIIIANRFAQNSGYFFIINKCCYQCFTLSEDCMVIFFT